MVREAVGRYCRLDFLVNNVGIGSRGSVVAETPETWRRVMQVNVESMFLASKAAIPEMIRTARGGAIVNISSISALRPRGLMTYSASKGAVIALTRRDGGGSRARRHLGQLRCPRPGVHADGLRRRHDGRRPRTAPARLGARPGGHRLGHRPGRPLPALGPRRYITGHVLVVDGGATLVGPARESQAEH
jgi:NAD(P)-dependent dehydrogenase (short-subunit alcohol dehydrogenase family)